MALLDAVFTQWQRDSDFDVESWSELVNDYGEQMDEVGEMGDAAANAGREHGDESQRLAGLLQESIDTGVNIALPPLKAYRKVRLPEEPRLSGLFGRRNSIPWRSREMMRGWLRDLMALELNWLHKAPQISL